jgi:hypothetical protein
MKLHLFLSYDVMTNVLFVTVLRNGGDVLRLCGGRCLHEDLHGLQVLSRVFSG